MSDPSPSIDLNVWEAAFETFVQDCLQDADSAHDMAHIRRVVVTARRLAIDEQANLDVVVPAAWLHDCVTVAKDSKERSLASKMAAERADRFLREESYPFQLIAPICHAIEAHSYSAGIPPETLEAKIVQDADRLDALGAIGVARCLMVGGDLGRPLYNPAEPLPKSREPDDSRWVLDHFYVKVLRLPEAMQTTAGRAEAHQRAAYIHDFLHTLEHEIA